MPNKYLEKIAVLNMIAGGAAANKGDRLGGAVIGGIGGGSVGFGLGHAVGSRLSPGLGAIGGIAGGLAGGALGGRAYSAGKKAVLGSKYRDREAEDRALRSLAANTK